MNSFIVLEKNNEFDYQDYLINAELIIDIDRNDYHITILRPINDFDINKIESWIVELFIIRLLNILELKNLVESNCDLSVQYPDDIEIDSIEDFNIVYPPFNELTDFTDKLWQPYNGWIWDKTSSHWKPPIEKPSLSLSMSSKWNNDWLNWEISFGQTNIPRQRRAFQLWLSSEVDGSSMFLDACSTKDYMIKPFENLTHGTRSIENLIKEYNDKIAAEAEIARPYMSILGHIVVVDLSPIALITYSECHTDAVEMFNKLYSMHPQFFARTSHELFRLVIEWAYAHTELGNNELTAITCHDILKAVQMPKDIRDGLISMKPQQVGKFLERSSSALIEDDEDPEVPTGFNKWVNTLYYHYPHLELGQEVHINTLPSSYPM